MRVKHGLILTLCVTAVGVLAAQMPMREGRWEVTTQMQMPNVAVKIPETTTTQCVTAAQLKNPTAALLSSQGGESCKVTDFEVSGNTVTWKMSCSAPQATTGSAELNFVGDTYTGTVMMNTAQGDMTMKMAGKRVGDCAK